MDNIAVVGAGNGGQLLAGHLASKGHRINLFDIKKEIIDEINQRGGIISFDGVIAGEGKVSCATTDLHSAMEGTEIIMIATLTKDHIDVAKSLAPYLTEKHLVVLIPGGTFGALTFKAVLRKNGFQRLPVIAECQDLIYTCRSISPGISRAMGIKKDIPVAAIPASAGKQVAERLNGMLPYFKPMPNIIYTSLGNLAPVAHPGPSVLNAARIEAQKEPIPYLETITPSVARLMEKIDEERRSIAAALGTELISQKQWMQDCYGIEGKDIYECYRNAVVYSELKAQTSLKARYITEDIPCGLVPMIAVAKIAGVNVPAMEALVTLCGIITEEDYEQTGRNIDRLGLRNMNMEEFLSSIQ